MRASEYSPQFRQALWPPARPLHQGTRSQGRRPKPLNDIAASDWLRSPNSICLWPNGDKVRAFENHSLFGGGWGPSFFHFSSASTPSFDGVAPTSAAPRPGIWHETFRVVPHALYTTAFVSLDE